ncbi:MAG: hypothetical protein AB1490_29190 [Pseudomonadota bacterium]
MFVKLAADGHVSLEERDNFRAFKLVVEGDAAQLDNARAKLKGAADVPDQGTAWIFESWLRANVSDSAWQQSLGAMIEKAKPHGWIDEQRKAIKAHIEWRAV